MNYALMLAGGTGTRLGGSLPKQYVRVGDMMMITYTLKALLSAPELDHVLIGADSSFHAEILKDAETAGLDTGKLMGFSEPGESRQGSIRNGLEKIMKEREGYGDSREDTVLVHDAARPMLSGKLIRDCFTALPGHDGVMPVLPMKDTVYYSADGKKVDQLLERQNIYAGQAPELFLLEKYYRANMSLTEEELGRINGSTELALKFGMDIALILGDEANFKVTTPADMERFRELMGR